MKKKTKSAQKTRSAKRVRSKNEKRAPHKGARRSASHARPKHKPASRRHVFARSKKKEKSPVKPPVTQPEKVSYTDDDSGRTLGLTPMRIYLNQIEHIPLLTPDDEIHLSRLIQLKKGNFKEARKRMINSNLRLVINMAKRYMNMGLPFSDLVEEGNIGLMRAVDKFNYKRGYRFSTYASWWIKQAMMRALSNQGKIIRIPVHMYESITRWRKVREYLMQKLDRIPTHKEIAKLMKVGDDKIKEIEQAAQTAPSSLNAPVSIEGDAEMIDMVEDATLKTPHEEAHHVSKTERIEQLLSFVNDREKKILILRFGLYDNEPHTLEATAQQFGITRERVRQIEEAAIQKLRAHLREQKDELLNYL